MSDNIESVEPLPAPETSGQPDNNTPAPEAQDPVETVTAPNVEPIDETPKEPPPKKTAWYMHEIGKERERNQTLKAQNEALQERLLSLQSAKPNEAQQNEPNAKPNQNLTDADIDRLVTERAQSFNAAQTYANTCNNIYDSGVKDFTDFDESVKILGAVGILPPANQAPSPFMQMVTELPDAHKILQQLAQDPDRASQLLNMPIAKQALELAKMQTGLNAPKPAKPISNAPAPINPINGTGKAEPNVERAGDMKEYIAARNKERAAKGKPLFY